LPKLCDFTAQALDFRFETGDSLILCANFPHHRLGARRAWWRLMDNHFSTEQVSVSRLFLPGLSRESRDQRRIVVRY
jgi:hypothetical protein